MSTTTDTAKKSNEDVNGNKEVSALPKLPLPKLEDTCKRYLRALEALQDRQGVSGVWRRREMAKETRRVQLWGG
jgi:hypothetical protein